MGVPATDRDWDRLLARIAGSIGMSYGGSAAQGESSDPFRLLIGTMISLRTKDEVTDWATRRLFERAPNPRAMLGLRREEIERLIFPAGFYRNKASNILEVSRRIVKEHEGKVPDTFSELTGLPGVGPKTANLVLSMGFGIPAICVDTHVHRISNRLGWVNTRNPKETEEALRQLLPRRLWIPLNGLMVRFGQRICVPVSPWCSRCPLRPVCPREGVKRSR